MDHREDHSLRSKKNTNPLAQARKRKVSRSSKQEDVWFRRTGEGYRLFLEYYAQQPIGTVCTRAVQVKADDMAVHSHSPPDQNPMGMSRAAKKRRKKKKTKQNEKLEFKKEESAISQTPMPVATTSDCMDCPLMKQYKRMLQAKAKADRNQPALEFLSDFCKALCRPLPLSLRVRKSTPESQRKIVLQALSSFFGEHVKAVPWDKHIFQAPFESPKNTLCKSNLKQNAPDFYEWILMHSQNGSIARQEIGSMLPILALERLEKLRPSKTSVKLIDMCASPGSKTLQALEALEASNEKNLSRQATKGKVVIANDVSEQRLSSLRDAVERSGIPEEYRQKITYSCQDASRLQLPTKAISSAHWSVILCDVPCSGDGTIRKDAHILPNWKPELGNALHPTQLRILQRALELIPVGGTVCYSTCSLNPIENEAVVAAALSKFPDQVRLVEFPTIGDGFVRRPGVCQWKVAMSTTDMESKDSETGSGQASSDDDDERLTRLSFVDSYQNAVEIPMEHATPTLWSTPNEAENKKLNLERCTRLFPQDMDTGGFFVALLEKWR